MTLMCVCVCVFDHCALLVSHITSLFHLHLAVCRPFLSRSDSRLHCDPSLTAGHLFHIREGNKEFDLTPFSSGGPLSRPIGPPGHHPGALLHIETPVSAAELSSSRYGEP